MIVERTVFHVKAGCTPALVELLKQEIEGNTAYTRSYRILTPYVSPFDVVVVEREYEDMQEKRATWGGWSAKPETPEFWEKFYELAERGGHREIWGLAAQR
jgi:hypothetical protein